MKWKILLASDVLVLVARGRSIRWSPLAHAPVSVRKIAPDMYALYFLLEHAVFIFAAWTLSYHLCLLARWPAYAVCFPALVIYAVIFFSIGRPRRKILLSVRRHVPLVASAAALGLLVAVFTLLFFRSDADDMSFFHRVLVQLGDLRAPFILVSTQHNVPDLPAISVMHLMTSYEPLMAILGRILVNDPLWFYQNAGAALAAFLTPVVYVLLFRRLRLSPIQALCAAAAVMTFLLLDGGLPRSFGSFAFIRLWQGKTILITLVLPLIFLFCLRFLAHPSPRRFLAVFLACVCSLGLSSSSLFLVPMMLFASCAAYCLSFGFTFRRLRRAIALGAGGAYPLAIAAALVFRLLPRPENTQAWEVWWPSVWWRSILFVLPDARTVARSALALFLLPAVLMSFPFRRFLVLFSVTLIIVFANPFTGPSVIKAVKPAVYWRLIYLFPIPLCLGLAVRGFFPRRLSTASLVRMVVSCIAVLAVVWSFGASVFSGARFKKPCEYKLPPDVLAFCRTIDGRISRGASVLAPEEVAWVLGLVRPDVRFEVHRALETQHVFRCAGKPLEGKLRLTAQKVVTNGPLSTRDEDAFLSCLQHNIDYVIVRDRALDAVLRLLETAHFTPNPLAQASGFTLLALPPSASLP